MRSRERHLSFHDGSVGAEVFDYRVAARYDRLVCDVERDLVVRPFADQEGGVKRARRERGL